MLRKIKIILILMVFFDASPSLMAQSLDPLLEGLQSNYSFTRLLALQELGRRDFEEQLRYLPALIEALKDHDLDVQSETVKILSGLGHGAEPGLPAMIQHFRESDGKGRDATLMVLAALGQRAVPALVEALEVEDPAIRLGACRALGRIGKEAQEAVPVLIRLFDEVRRDLPDCASVTIGKIGAVDDLIEIIRSGNDQQRAWISKKSFYHLPEEIDPTEALTELAKIENDPKTRLAAIDALGSRGSKSKNAVSLLVGTLADQQVGFAAASALGKIGLSALSNTIEALSSANFIVRSWAAHAIKSMEQPAVEAVPSLIKLLDDKELVVSLDARSALERIGTPKALDAVKRSGVNLR